MSFSTVFYRALSRKLTKFNKELRNITSSIIKENKCLIMNGDCNIDVFKYNKFFNTQHFFDILFECNYIPINLQTYKSDK